MFLSGCLWKLGKETKEQYMTRQEYNYKIYECLKEDSDFEVLLLDNFEEEQIDNFYKLLYECIEKYPQQRFGQIMCNYIIYDYRNLDPSELTIALIEYLFPEKYDPFFEESEETYHRLTGYIPENLKKELEEKKGKKVYYKSGENTKIGVLEDVVYDFGWCWEINDDLIPTETDIRLV